MKCSRATTIKRRLYSLLLIQISILLIWFLCVTAVEKQGNIEMKNLQTEQLAARIYSTFSGAMDALSNVTLLPIQRDVNGVTNDVYKYLSDHQDEDNYTLAYISAFETMSAGALKLNPSLSCMAVINRLGKGLILNGKSFWSRSTVFEMDMSQPWIQTALDGKGKVSDPIAIESAPFGSLESEPLILRARAIVIAESYHSAGIAIAGISPDLIIEMFEAERLYSDQEIVLFNSSLQILAGKNDAEFLKDVCAGSGAFSINREINGKRYLLSTYFPPNACFGVRILTPRIAVMRTIGRYAVLLYLFIALLTGCTIVLSAAIFRRIRQPIQLLLTTVDAYSRGNFTERAEKTGTREFDILAEALNHMSDDITRLIRDAYQSRMEAQEYEIQVLRNQINPHFLYNALESARMRAYINGDEEVERIITHLAAMLRYGLVASSEPVTLEMEIRHAQDYLDVANACAHAPAALLITLEDACMQCRLPRVTLQPILENCIRHGFGKGERAGTITLYGYMENGTGVITISDNGTGVGTARLEAIRASLRETEQGTNGSIGLHNVHRRLQLLSGSECGLSVNSVEGIGFSVTLRLAAPNEGTIE